MINQDDTVASVDHMEAALRRLDIGNSEYPGACHACLQAVITAGHLPPCALPKVMEGILV